MVSIGSREYWSDPGSYPAGWEARAVQAARFIPPGCNVLDIGCGPHKALRRYLPVGCTYSPADLYQWTPEVHQADIDTNIFPEGTFGCVVLLGVIEYLQKPELAFRFAKGCASAMVISYCHPLIADPRPRVRVGWVNAFSLDELSNLAAKNGWVLTQSATFQRSAQTHQMIYALSSTGQSIRAS
jgi:hypothetical protein